MSFRVLLAIALVLSAGCQIDPAQSAAPPVVEPLPPAVIVRWEPTLNVTNEWFDCLNWPAGLVPDRRAVVAILSPDGHELEVRVGYVLASIHEAAILKLRDDQTAHAAMWLQSDTGSIDEDSDRGLTGEIYLSSLDWKDPHICGKFELHWMSKGQGRCRHGSFSIEQSDIRR